MILVKPEDVDSILGELNRFRWNLELAVDKFEDSVLRFFGLQIHRYDLSICQRIRTLRNLFIMIASGSLKVILEISILLPKSG